MSALPPWLKRPAVRNGLCLLLLAALAGLFFQGGLFGDHRTLIWDAADYHFPNLNLVSRLWRSHQLPLWNPFLFNGYPLIAQPHSQVFYLPNLLITLVTAFTPRAVYFQLVLHFVMGGFFTYLLAGLWMESTPARLLAGVVYMLNGYMWNHFEHLAIVDTAIWLPLVLYAVERAWRRHTPASFALAVASIALLILAGHPQTFYYSLLVVALTTPFWVLEARGSEPRSGWRPIVVFGAALAAAVLLCAVQLLPTWELSRLSNRSGKVPYAIAIAAGALEPSHLITLFLPDFYGALRGPYVGQGDVSQSSIYFGVLPLLLAGFVLAGRPSRRGVYLVLMALTSALVSLGPTGLIGPLLYYVVPFFGMFRSPSNFAFIFVLYGALLAGHGLEILQKNELRPGRYGAYLGGLGLTAWLLIHFVSHVNPRVRANLDRSAIVLGAGLIAVLLLTGLRRAQLLGQRACGWTALGLCCVELFVVGADALTLGQRTGQAAFCEERAPAVVAAAGGLPGQGCQSPDPPVVDEAHAAAAYRLHVDEATYRASSPVTDVGQLGRVGFDRFALHQGYLTDGWDPMVLKRHVDFHLLVQRISLQSRAQPIAQKAAAMGKVLAAANVKYLLLPRGLVEVPDPLPRAYFVERARAAAGESAALQLLEDPAVDLHSEVIVEGDVRPDDSAPPRRFIPVRFLSQQAARVRLRVDAPRAGYVVFSDTFYPGWEAVVNGRPTPISRANQSFKAVRVDAGPSEVSFQFRPRSLRIGAWLSVLTLLLGAGALFARGAKGMLPSGPRGLRPGSTRLTSVNPPLESRS
jgi:hypothetical protein